MSAACLPFSHSPSLSVSLWQDMCFEFVACINFLELILFFLFSRVRVVPYKFHANARFLCAPNRFQPIRYPILCKQMMPLGVALQLPACSPFPALPALCSSVCRIDQLPQLPVGFERFRSGISFDSSTLWQPPAAVPTPFPSLLLPLLCSIICCVYLLCSICGWTIDTIVFASRLDLCSYSTPPHCLWAIFNYLYYVSVTLCVAHR